MKYVISDIHGCYREYMELLEKLSLSDRDHLYVLGDAVDKGPEPVRVLQDIMQRKNLTYIMGNHDYMLLYFLKKFGLDLSGGKSEMCKPEDRKGFYLWLGDGGSTTASQYLRLPLEERKAICSFLEKAGAYETVEDAGKKYILVHAGIAGFREELPLGAYEFTDFLCEQADYKKRYYQDPDIFLISGHTPTICIHEDFEHGIYMGNGHIAVDCGCVYGGALAAYCIETGEAVYAESMQSG